MKNWFEIKNMGHGVMDISINDEIGLWGVSASDFIAELNENKDAKSINLSIHSPGGNMLDGFAMYNALISHDAKVYANVTGIAASAASMVLMAGDVISMPEDAFVMIHNPSGIAWGGSEEMRDYADLMDKLRDSAVNIYSKKTGLSNEEIITMLDAETWMNGNDALDKGFVDTVTDKVDVAAKIGVFNKYFKTMPVKSEYDYQSISNVKEFNEALRNAGASKNETEMLIGRAKVVFRSNSEDTDNSLSELSNALNKVKIPTQLNET